MAQVGKGQELIMVVTKGNMDRNSSGK